MKRPRRAFAYLFAAAALCAGALAGTPCAHAAREEKAKSLQIHLEPSGATPGAWGRAKYRVGRGHRRLAIETHGLHPGAYDVLVGAGAVGSFEVTEGTVPDEASTFVLDSRQTALLFDPRGTVIEVVNQASGMTELSIGEFPANKREEMEQSRIRLDFKSTDVQPAASGSAEFRSYKGRSRFVIKVAGLAPGTYELVIGGTPEAFLRVVSLDEVEVSFDTIPEKPEEGDEDLGDEELHRLLTFDPRGFPVSLTREGGVAILSIDMYPAR